MSNDERRITWPEAIRNDIHDSVFNSISSLSDPELGIELDSALATGVLAVFDVAHQNGISMAEFRNYTVELLDGIITRASTAIPNEDGVIHLLDLSEKTPTNG